MAVWINKHSGCIVNLLEHSAGFDDMEFGEVYNRQDRADYPLLDVFKRFQEPENVRWPAGTRTVYWLKVWVRSGRARGLA